MHYIHYIGLQYRQNSYMHVHFTRIYMCFQAFVCIHTNLRLQIYWWTHSLHLCKCM